MAKNDGIKKEYRRVRKNLQRQVKSLLNRGYTFAKEIIPKIPKNIRKESITNLEKIKENIYKKATYQSETGNVYSGEERRQQERSEAATKAAETRKERAETQRRTQEPIYLTDAVLNNVESLIYTLKVSGKEKSASEIESIVEQEIANLGRDRYAMALEPHKSTIDELEEKLMRYVQQAPPHQSALLDLIITLKIGEAPSMEDLVRWEENSEQEDGFTFAEESPFDEDFDLPLY